MTISNEREQRLLQARAQYWEDAINCYREVLSSSVDVGIRDKYTKLSVLCTEHLLSNERELEVWERYMLQGGRTARYFFWGMVEWSTDTGLTPEERSLVAFNHSVIVDEWGLPRATS